MLMTNKEGKTMKRTFMKFLPIAAAVLLATSCSKDNDSDNSVAPAPAVETQDVASPTESTTVPFSIKVAGGGSLSKVAYKDDGSTVTVKFDATTDAGREMTVTGDGKTTTLKLSKVDAGGVATFDGVWEGGEPGEGKTITATINIAATGGDKSSFTEDAETLEDLMAKCGHTYTGTFKYKVNDEVTLADDKAYIEIIMSPLQHDIDLTIGGTPTNYAMNNGKVWIAVAGGTKFTTNFTDEKTCTAGGIKTINREGFVDLGIKDGDIYTGILWADHNIGGSNPWDYGNYYAWGEVDIKDDYSWNTYTRHGDGTSGNVSKKYNSNDNKTILDSDDDIAYQTYKKDKVSMPTSSEFVALKSSCYWVWTDDYNDSHKKGYIVYKAKAADHAGKVKNATSNDDYVSSYTNLEADTHVFLPSAGIWTEGTIIYSSYVGGDASTSGPLGMYWSSSLTTRYTGYAYYSKYADGLSFTDKVVVPDDYVNRCIGKSVRAVRRR